MSQDRASQYQSAYMADYGFERVQVHYRCEFLLERLSKLRPAVVVEVGCGSELLYETWRQRRGTAESWLIVEPAEHFARIARDSKLPGLHVVNDYLERAVPEVKAHLPRQPDMVICSSLLHEVPSPAELLSALQEVMGTSTILHINVPNSESFHRRLAKAMGLISDTKTASERNLKLSQQRVYDMPTLKADLAASGLSVIEEGGYLIKPFTHQQMEGVAPVIGEGALDGLFQLGKQLPELASECFVEARKTGRG